MTLAELLAPYGVTGDEYLAELAAALISRPVAGSATLNAQERSVLDRLGGVTVPTDQAAGDTSRAWVRNSTDNLAQEVRDSLSVERAAQLLGITPSRVRHRVNEHALHSFKIGNRLRLPAWQFDEGAPLPGLRTVLASLRADLHPLEVAGFMNNPESDLEVEGQVLSPRAWLLSGGEVVVVADLAKQVGTIW
jgi:hypothetical protein